MYNKYKAPEHHDNLSEKAKTLRKNMTWHEKRLWYCFLKDYPLKFYKQRIIHTYIADFYCSKARLVIEIDGSHHYKAEYADKDDERTEIINTYNLKVLRFSNIEIQNNFRKVCEIIDKTVKAQLLSLSAISNNNLRNET